MKPLFRFVASAFLLCLIALSPSSADEWNIYTHCNDVTSIAQEGDFIWWTGNTGMVRYNRLNGDSMVYTIKDYGEGGGFLSSAVASDGTKWFGTIYGKVARLNESGWTVFSDLYDSNYSDNKIYAIVCDRTGVVWFAMRRGVIKFDGSVWTRYRAAEGFSDEQATTALLDGDGNLWFGTAGDGLFRFDGAMWTKYTQENGLPKNSIQALSLGADGTVWVGTSKGLAAFDHGAWKTLPSLGDNDHPLESIVTALAIDREGGVWAGTEANLVYLRGNEKTVYTAANSTLADDPYKRVHALLVDTDGVLWVINGKPGGPYTPHMGLARFDGKNWSRVKIPEPVGNVTWSAAVDKDNVKWFATGSSLGSDPLVSFDGANWKKYTEADGLTDLWVYSIILDDSGRKWFCTGKGVTCFDGKTWTSYTAENGFPGNKALKGAIDRDGVGWFILDTGLYSFDGHTWTSWNDTVRSFGDGNAFCVAVDRNNVKWFGFSLSGPSNDCVLSFDGAAWRCYTQENGLPHNRIQCITVDRENVVWVGFQQNGRDVGIAGFDGKEWKVSSGAGLWGNVTGIAVDETNLKWIVTDTHSHSVYSFDGEIWKAYSPQWGVGLGSYNCIAIDHDGTKWLGSKTMGLVSFRESDGTVTGVNSSDELPKGFAILGIHPNPFNPSTTISFSLPSAAQTTLAVYDITGRKVRALISGSQSAGSHSALWDGRDAAGRSVSSGVYIARLESGKSAQSMKMLLMR